ncbi:esterase/lipase family protein [Streptomyces sp. NPDC059524]|uniref:esterase/lipase family protein n=1 Tax=Streptomyces sp. NPDC059524 TaxID=3346856 RepID=UPI0036B3C9EC
MKSTDTAATDTVTGAANPATAATSTPHATPAGPASTASRALSTALTTLSALVALADLPPFRALPRRLLPGRLAGLSTVLVKATALELAILAGHLVLYPSGLTPERRAPRVPAPADVPSATPERPPVLLLHGFIDNRSVFVLLRRALAQHGTRHLESLNYSPLTCDIKAAATLLGRHVEELCERTGRDRIDIVGHSLGGLIARYYVQRLGGDRRVRTVVTLGTPHSGTRVAPLADAHPIVRQMRPGSSVIEELKEPAPGCTTRFVSFWSDLDPLMVPLETACVDHPDLIAQNVRVTGIGHLALPVHPAVAAAVREALAPDPVAGANGGADTRGGLTVA